MASPATGGDQPLPAAHLPRRIGVAGAGTMGAGIAQLAALAGFQTVLYDPFPAAVEKGITAVRAGLESGIKRKRWTARQAQAAIAQLTATAQPHTLAGCELVIEAVPEQLELKLEVVNTLFGACGSDVIVASNTSSIPIVHIAAASPRPEHVLGLHFFNPAPLMELVELVPAIQTGDRARQLAREAAEAMGKRVVEAKDVPGFLANRCGRPFYNEALRLLQERCATVEQIDWICRRGGGFRMGPFELMDLVGIDVGFAIAKSFFEQSFGEPRWRPSPLQAYMAAAGRLGRKTGRGWYVYGEDRPYRPDDDPNKKLSEVDAALLRRIQCCIVNEGFFALGEGIGTAGDIDIAAKLGLNWPRGPFELGQKLGFDSVCTMMDELFAVYREERYRAAPLLREAAA